MIDVEPVVRHWSENHWRGHLKAHRTAASLFEKGLFPGLSDAPRAAWTRDCMRSATARGGPEPCFSRQARSVITQVPPRFCEHCIGLRRSAFFMARSVLRDILSGAWTC